MIIFFFLDHFTGIDYLTTVIKSLFLEKQVEEKFFLKYLNDEEKTKERSCCRAFCDDFIVYNDEKLDEARCEVYKKNCASENTKVQESLTDGDVDMSDIKTMVFDIFSSRKKFTYDFRERLTLYFGFLGPVYKCLRCKCFNHERMIHVNKVFERAQDRLNKDADIIEIMDQVRKSKNFQRNFLKREQKILLKFD
jgi:excinuclease UvrABC ATPase subunit